MNQEERKALGRALDMFLNDSLERILLNHSCDEQTMQKSGLRPLIVKGKLLFQAEEQVGKQAFHRNMDKEQAAEYVTGLLEGQFRQAEITSELGTALVLVSKKGRITVKVKHRAQPVSLEQEMGGPKADDKPARIRAVARNSTICPEDPGDDQGFLSHRNLSHNRKKTYILREGSPIPFLVNLGVMTRDGKIVNSRYDKYRQINRFLEFIEDILPNLSKEKETTIIDFGCGKSYLTFAMYYYLKELKGYQVRIIGLDLKQDVIDRCNRLGRQYGYDALQFYHGDIASYEGVDHVDMVVTLHACDLATDYALAKAVNWGAKVILSVPCCQHEMNGQMKNDIMSPVFKYGLIKERMAALYTDAIRAGVLEYRGYKTQILEFIDMDSTPKNILIRAVKQGKEKRGGRELKELTQFLQADPSIIKLLAPELERE